ncbi:hypothetical protein lerEdw1_004428 [Lerista edwardsae]|nr:hypothetical protein lerEdw1_004428 [Lerista edwardsae]
MMPRCLTPPSSCILVSWPEEDNCLLGRGNMLLLAKKMGGLKGHDLPLADEEAVLKSGAGPQMHRYPGVHHGRVLRLLTVAAELAAKEEEEKAKKKKGRKKKKEKKEKKKKKGKEKVEKKPKKKKKDEARDS